MIIKKYFMIERLKFYYLLINYTAQKLIGWKNAKEGLFNLILVHIVFLSSGIVIYFSSFYRSISIYIVLLYLLLYWFVLSKRIVNKLDNKINFQLLDKEFNKISQTERIVYVLFSLLMIFFVCFSTVFIIRFLVVVGNI